MKTGSEASSGTGRERKLCLTWFVVFTLLAGGYWPNALGVTFMALAYLGVLHLAMLAVEEVTAPQFHADISPEEFERYCAAVLRERKWDARVTPAGGDQGVDIVADKRGLRIVVQCKKYSKPVGNRAVQEIVAGIAHQDAQRGVVVTTSGSRPRLEGSRPRTRCCCSITQSCIASTGSCRDEDAARPE